MADKRTIGLLTGTFDPVHLGHTALAEAAAVSAGLDEVWLLVNPEPAHKADTAAYEHRLEMARLAVVGRPKIRVYEGKLSDSSHNMRNFLKLTDDYPNDRFVFIVGMDTIGWLDRWEAYETVVERATFAVAHRAGTSTAALDDLKRRLGSLRDRLKTQLFDFEGFGEVSSTAIRGQIAAGERPESLDERVYNYILDQGLYKQIS